MMATFEERLLVRAYYLSKEDSSDDVANYYQAELEEITPFLIDEVNSASDALSLIERNLRDEINRLDIKRDFNCNYELRTLGSLRSRTCCKNSDVDIDLVINPNDSTPYGQPAHLRKVVKQFAQYFQDNKFKLNKKLDDITRSIPIHFQGVDFDIFVKTAKEMAEADILMINYNNSFILGPLERATILALKLWKNKLNIIGFKSCQFVTAIRAINSHLPHDHDLHRLEASKIFRRQNPHIWQHSDLVAIKHQTVVEYAQAVVGFMIIAFNHSLQVTVTVEGSDAKSIIVPELDSEWKEWKKAIENKLQFDFLCHSLNDFIANPKAHILTSIRTCS
ncbi:hypothetical protein CYY_003206 [Polysphondylium violaceum]|uniref:Uncharacterized protein n=1 Tax=Polysphondylium violaceum TaxID=133409 RepID=A0A8J4PYU4_9MYCE|nr:hypothetical protein CYY_003206 [Polysphondylium violaceum]